MSACIPTPAFDAAPWRLSGTVIAALLDDPAQLAALGDAIRQPPYKAAPRAPVLAVRPRNTLAASGATFAEGAACVLGATIGLVIGRTACRVSVADAAGHIAGCVLVADLALPSDSHYRPAVHLRARDGACVIGPRVAAGLQPAGIRLDLHVDGASVQRVAFDGRVRSPQALLADVSSFMTLRSGDLLLMGSAHDAPLLHPGQRYAISADRLGTLSGSIA